MKIIVDQNYLQYYIFQCFFFFFVDEGILFKGVRGLLYYRFISAIKFHNKAVVWASLPEYK